ncbi:hypothetical protein ONS95_002640 [Cadophora gregata]|uniref:uncharacterized protein n=1 Tax=Cadophora gregata TaxID=51156 RepID=UPI0026DB0EB5|nr:uncharacterized protein ONS95_002640 [Cadophora gregata]KAK0109973.1 hypothetical protein ONS95_002640 [Cadophora gregata]KAK0110401.1 hypothetical protein ONS96_002014 [Cadophora gregata f. sp. sojae]
MAHIRSEETTLEWFGATTFRLRSKGVTIFLDTWLDRPSVLPVYLSVNDVTEADYIFISHAHFDHLPGADRIAIKTGAIVIANCEAISHLRAAGVPEAQLMPVAGGERIPLFTKGFRQAAAAGIIELQPGPPAAPPVPHHSLAAFSVHVWPSLHCLMPGSHTDIPDVIDSGKRYTGEASPYSCTVDVNRGMKYGLLNMGNSMPRDAMVAGVQSFVDYISDKRNVFSGYDGGQLMYNILLGDKTILWSAHLGAYKEIMVNLEPKPDLAILGIAGRGNLNGRPYDGSAAEFAVDEIKWLKEPKTIIWCLHDESAIKPYRIDTGPATERVHRKTRSKVLSMEHGVLIKLDS